MTKINKNEFIQKIRDTASFAERQIILYENSNSEKEQAVKTLAQGFLSLSTDILKGQKQCNHRWKSVDCQQSIQNLNAMSVER